MGRLPLPTLYEQFFLLLGRRGVFPTPFVALERLSVLAVFVIVAVDQGAGVFGTVKKNEIDRWQ